MIKRFILVDETIVSQEELEKKRKRNLIIALFVFFMSFRFLDNWFIDIDAPYDVKVRHGAMFHALGFGGKVLLIVAVCCVAQPGLFRLLFWTREKNNRLRFLGDFSSFTSSFILRTDTKQSFAWKIKMYYSVASFAGSFGFVVAILFSSLIGVYAAFPDPTAINIMIWVFWVALNIVICYFILPDLMILGCFWFVMRTHVKLVVEEILLELQGIRTNEQNFHNNRSTSDALFNRYLRTWISRYNSMIRILLDFDDFSKNFMFVVSSTSSVMCSAFLFGILMTGDIVMKCILTPNFFSFTANAMILMSAATSINSLGKTMYKELNTVFVRYQHKLSIEHKVLLKQLIEDTGNERYPSVSLITANGTPFESMSFAAFIVSFITLFLMMFDFLHKVF